MLIKRSIQKDCKTSLSEHFPNKVIAVCTEDMINDLILFPLKLAMSSKKSLVTFQYDDVSDMSMIGQGSFGKIYQGIYGEEKVVVKVLEDVDNEDICQEAKFLDKLAHPNIVQFKGICLEEEGIMLEYMVFDLKPYGVNVEVHNL